MSAVEFDEHGDVIMDPRLTDDQIMSTFTPIERQLYEWIEGGGLRHKQSFPLDYWRKNLEKKFPNEKDIRKQYRIYMQKWYGRLERRERRAVSRDELFHILTSTCCKDAGELSNTLWQLSTSFGIPDLLLGTSRFGGVLTAYAVAMDYRFLHPDLSSNPSGQHLLDRAIMALNIDYRSTPTPLLPNQAELAAERRHRREHWSSSEGSTLSMRSATSDDFVDNEPFCFFQLGCLMACSGDAWTKVCDEGEEEIGEADWEPTGYGVVVKLDRAGYPRGPVFAIYNFRRPTEDRYYNQRSEEIEWRDARGNELKHICRLYPKCRGQFFLAQIADKLEDLTPTTQFNFDVVRRYRSSLVQAKLPGPSQMIIPSDILGGRDVGGQGAWR
ncbi:hypothetical protein B0T10DRAFT_488005 [Thelonectria olida]|uniref:Uncharacterized protein n=1 Tax=Thelonectria olida TaxID=1576542 RepID=A0A9P9APA8_9HYPO|nr:hypothetical protein B0T10DRAFT_488005 [Thelonectria olida]